MHHPRIAIVGDAGIDITVRTAGHRREKVAADDGLRALGGTGANAALAAVRLGSRVRLACSIGDDRVGTWVQEELATAGIEAEAAVHQGRSEIAIVLIEGGKRRLIVDPGVAYDFSDVLPSRLGRWADVIYATHARPALALALAEATSRPLVLGLEPGDLTLDGWAPAIARATVAITNAAGEAGLGAVAGRVAAVIVTHGAAGATLRRGRTEVVLPAPPVEVVDATGAGDCFAGALCHFLAGGRDLMDAARFAVMAASLSTRGLGAHGALPTEADVLRAAGDGT